MADRKKWPEAKWKVASPNSLPDWARGPELRKELQAEMLLAFPIMLVAIGVPFGIAFTLFALYAPSGTGPIATWIGLGLLILFPVTLIATGRWGQEWSARRHRRRVLDHLEARGESVLGGEMVGVTYSDTIWRDSYFGDSWDWGALHLEMDRLSFVGRGSRFDLRPEAIENLEIKRLSHVFGSQARLFLSWTDNGKTETIIVELPYQRSRRRRFEEMENLCELIDRWRREPLPSYDKSPLSPPFRQEDLKPAINPFTQIGWPARILAGLAVILGGLACQVAIMLFLAFIGYPRAGGFLGGFAVIYVFAWIMIAGAIEKRLPAKWQHPEKSTILEEPSAVNLGGPIAEEEQVNLKA